MKPSKPLRLDELDFNQSNSLEWADVRGGQVRIIHYCGVDLYTIIEWSRGSVAWEKLTEWNDIDGLTAQAVLFELTK